MKHINEYLLSKKTKQKTWSSIDEFADVSLESISVFQRPQYMTLFDAMKNKKSTEYFEVVCSKLLDLCNEGYKYEILNYGCFDNVTDNFRGFMINSKGPVHSDGISFDIYNVAEMVQIDVELKRDKLFIREGNMPNKELLMQAIARHAGIYFKNIYELEGYDPNKLREFKEKLDELIK